MGWVQAGEPLDEGLLASAGPIPFIKGISDSIVRSSSRQAINAQIAPINPADVRRFEVAFNDANPVLGILDREQVIMTLLRNDLSYNSATKIMDLAGESHKKFDIPKFALALHLGDLLQSSKLTSLPSAIPQYLRDQVSYLKTPDSPLPPPSPTLSNYSVSSTRTLTPKQFSHLKTPDSPLPPPPPTLSNYYVSSTLTPKQSPAKLEEVDLPSKLESDLRWVKSQIEKNGAIDGEIILKFMADYNFKPVDFAHLWSSSIFDKNNRLTGDSLDLFIERLREKAVEQDASEPPSYSPVHRADEISTDLSRKFAYNGPLSPPFPVTQLDSHPSPNSPPSYYLFRPHSPSTLNVYDYNPNPSDVISPFSLPPLTNRPYSPSSINVFDYNPNPTDVILPISLPPLTNETLCTTTLEGIKAEVANLLHRVESSFRRQSDQRNRLQFSNQMLFDENQALQSKVRDLEAKLSDSIPLSEHRRLQHQHIQEIDRLKTDLHETKELLVSFRDQHEAQETALRECQSNLAGSQFETEQLRQSTDAQVALIADLRIELAEKEKDMADLISKTNKPDMRLLYVKASLRESEASLAKAQNENKNLLQLITTQREEISKLPVRSTAEPAPSSTADDDLLQSLARGQGRLSLEVKEMRQMVEQFISSAQSSNTELNTHPMAQYRDNMDARSSVETIRMGWGSRPDLLANHGSHEQPTLPELQCSTPLIQSISASNLHAFPGNSTIAIQSSQAPLPSTETDDVVCLDSVLRLSSVDSGSFERYPFPDTHSPYDESTFGFDVVSPFEQSSQTSQATTIEPLPDENMDDFHLPNPYHSPDMKHSEDAELQEIRAEGAELSLQIERCLQQQITPRTNTHSPVPVDRPRIKYPSLISERDAERRQHQEDIRLLTEKLRDKEAECRSLKTQNQGSWWQAELVQAEKHALELRSTIDRQNEEIISLKRTWSYLDVSDPPSYDVKTAFSSS